MSETLAPFKDTSGGGLPFRFALTLLVNMVPLAGVMFWGWSPFELIFLYWLENVIIGLRTLVSILMSGRQHGYVGAIATGIFFTLHYGIFCLVHGMFVFALFGGSSGANPADAASFTNATLIGLAAIMIWQTALLIMHIRAKDSPSAPELMFSPYPRIIILHITILAGGFLLMGLDWPHVGVIILAVVKTAMDAAIILYGWTIDGDRTGKPAPRPFILPPERRRP